MSLDTANFNLIYDRTKSDETASAAIRKSYQKLGSWSGLTDAERAQLERGTLTYNTLNRVETATKTLAAELNAAMYPVTLNVAEKSLPEVPDSYTRLDYIESDGRQYIDISGTPDGMEIELTFACNPEGTVENALFGAQWSVNGFFLEVYAQGGGLRWHSGGGYVDVPVDDLTAKHTVRCKKGWISLDGGEPITFTTSGNDVGYPVRLFSVYNNGGYAGAKSGLYKLYACKVWVNGALRANFIPAASNFNGDIGVYDTEFQQLYGNGANEGAASYIRTLPENYTQLEYIQSSGTQFINTGIVPNANTTLDVDFQIMASGSDNGIIGVVDPNCCIVYTASTLYGAYKNGIGSSAVIDISEHYNGRMTAHLGNGEFYSDYGGSSFDPVTNWSTTASIYLFALNRNGTVYGRSSIRMYIASVYLDDGNDWLNAEFIPCKNPSGVIGMYETYSGQFYANSGANNFAAGSEIVKFIAGPEKAVEDRPWRETDTVQYLAWKTYLDNVERVKNAFYSLFSTPEIPSPDDKLDYVGTNNIEKVLADIDSQVDAMIASYRRCGTFRAGNNAVHLPLKGSA